ncbi:uncharacterized protein LOC111334904 [Stylophora pistillata]|uniref:uncharacterized protein LOC111334904 n=1 Tax=Stylophora pistillata TaxID=50429 RepID=UPI000C04B8E1|nr:uncharacterized protein LOC111334904 [Stylophora pistillata]
MLSKAFVISTMLGEKAISDDILLHSFKQYLSKSEEQVVCEALGRPVEEWDSDDKDDEDLLELLDRFGCRSLPTKENIKSLILEVAHKEIIQKAQYVADCWHYIFRGSLAEGKLSTLEGVCSVYQSLEPTTKKVLGMLCALPGTNAVRGRKTIQKISSTSEMASLNIEPASDGTNASLPNILTPPLAGCDQEPEEVTEEGTQPFAEPWEDSDLVLVVEDEKFHVHRQILSIHSPVFKAMLTTKFKEATAKEIPLPGKKANEVSDFLKQMYLKESDGVTLTKAEHLLKLADEYQTKSVFDLCVNYLRTLQRSKHNAIRILFLTNVTIMVREDERLDSVRSECYNLIENMALKKISKNEYFQNLDSDSLQNVFLQKVQRLENLLSEVHPQFIGLVEFCMTLCLNSNRHNSKIIRCPEHFSKDNKAVMDLNFRMQSCAVCRSMISQLVSLSNPGLKVSALFPSGVHSSFGKTSTGQRQEEECLYGGTSRFDFKLTSVLRDLCSTHRDITLEDSLSLGSAFSFGF